jgi:hypothetical protein
VLFEQDPLVSVKRPNQWFRITDCKADRGKLLIRVEPGALDNVQPADAVKGGS